MVAQWFYLHLEVTKQQSLTVRRISLQLYPISKPKGVVNILFAKQPRSFMPLHDNQQTLEISCNWTYLTYFLHLYGFFEWECVNFSFCTLLKGRSYSWIFLYKNWIWSVGSSPKSTSTQYVPSTSIIPSVAFSVHSQYAWSIGLLIQRNDHRFHAPQRLYPVTSSLLSGQSSTLYRDLELREITSHANSDVAQSY